MLGVYIMHDGVLSAGWQHEGITPKTVPLGCDVLADGASEQEVDDPMPKTTSSKQVPGIGWSGEAGDNQWADLKSSRHVPALSDLHLFVAHWLHRQVSLEMKFIEIGKYSTTHLVEKWQSGCMRQATYLARLVLHFSRGL